MSQESLIESSVLLDPELTAEQKILARCQVNQILDFEEVYGTKKLEGAKKVRQSSD